MDDNSIRQPPAFDPERLAELFADDYGALADVLHTAFASLGELIEGLSAQLASGNHRASLELSHELKGTSANIGASELAEFGRVIEMKLRGKEVAGVVDQLAALNQAYRRFVTAAKRYLEELARARHGKT